jgi:transposase InsO family protein
MARPTEIAPSAGERTALQHIERRRTAVFHGHRRRLLRSCDDGVSFWGIMQLELLDSKKWSTRKELANAIFEWVEFWYNPKRGHSSVGMHSLFTFEPLHSRSSQDR